MLKERRQVAETIAAQLFAAEAAIDAAIAATATLAATMMQPFAAKPVSPPASGRMR